MSKRVLTSGLLAIGLLLGLLLAPASAQDAKAQGGVKITEALKPFVDRHVLAGAVTLVANKDEVLSVESVGFSDIGAGKAMKADDLFWIASQSKPITAAALMTLVDEGKVKLDDPVEKYLPEFRGQMVVAEQDDTHTLLKPLERPVTVRNLLSHTAGFPFGSRICREIDARSLEVSCLLYALTPLKFQPGTKYDYSNAGINTAGRIIEVVSGKRYEDFLDERFFKPLGMKDTTFWPNDEQVARVAHSYKPNATNDGLEATTVGQLTYPLTNRRRGPSPAGGYFSTARDMAVFCQMILRGGEFGGKRYLSEASVRELTSTQTGSLLNGGNGEGGYGLGFSTSRKSGGEGSPAVSGECGHGGAYSTNMTIQPDRGLILIYMVQHAGYPADGGKSHSAFQQAAVEAFGKK